MRRQRIRAGIAVGVWSAAVLVSGAWCGHWFFNGGRALAEVTLHKSINAPLDLLARSCRGMDSLDFHRLGLVFAVVVALFPVLPRWWRKEGLLAVEAGSMRQISRCLRRGVGGFFLGLFFAFMGNGIINGWSSFRMPGGLLAHLVAAWAGAWVMEGWLRGLIWRVVCDAWKPAFAMVVVMFAHGLAMFAWFPPGMETWNPVLSSEWFGWSKAWLAVWCDGPVFLEWTLPVCLLALGLGAGRLHGRSLWMLSGVHAGFFFAVACTGSMGCAALGAMCSVATLDGRPWRFATS